MANAIWLICQFFYIMLKNEIMKHWRLLMITFVLLFIIAGGVKYLFFKSPNFVATAARAYRRGEIFPVKVEIENITHPINAVQMDIAYEAAKLEVVEISAVNSFANIFLEKNIDNKIGRMRLSGGLSSPGYHGPRGLFATVYFRAKTPGTTQVKFLPASLILINDGHGTNVLKNFPTVNFTISPETLSRQEQEKQNKDIVGVQVLGAESEKGQILLYEMK
jgi:hypothetical protein